MLEGISKGKRWFFEGTNKADKSWGQGRERLHFTPIGIGVTVIIF